LSKYLNGSGLIAKTGWIQGNEDKMEKEKKSSESEELRDNGIFFSEKP
jgi:hypothetical protein